MAESNAFAFVCEQLERDTSLDRLEARGTVRPALKRSGLEPRSVAPAQMRVVLERILPRELGTRGVDDCEGLCRRIIMGLSKIRAEALEEAPDQVFARLGGS